MRAQASLELFFSVSLFVLLLFWFNHFVGIAAQSQDAARTVAARSSLDSLVQAADAACLSQASITVGSPCFSTSNPVLLNASGRQLFLANASAFTRCPFEDSVAVAYACGQHWCFAAYPNGTMRLLEGACP